MTVKTRAELKAENAADFPDNTTRLISPADLRGQMDDIVDSAIFPEDDIDGAPGLPGPPGSDGASIDGVVALREIAPNAGFTVRLNYHTASGDYGSGLFRGVTTGGPYTDNDGTIIVPGGGTGSAAWLRVWDNVRAHVGWFGAKCDPVGNFDDTAAVKKALRLFTNGRTVDTGRSGVIDVGPGFAFSEPLVYGGTNDHSLRIVGTHSMARGGGEKSMLKYIGPQTTLGAFIFYGANMSGMETVNIVPGNALNAVLVTADNSYNHTATHAITAGADVVVIPSGASPDAKVQYLRVGAYLGVDTGDNFEVVPVISVNTAAGTFTAPFTKDHASGVQLGGGTPSSGTHIEDTRLECPASPIFTSLTTTSSGIDAVFTPVSMTGIEVGMALWLGKGRTAEVVYVKSVTNTTFTADSIQQHVAGNRVMYATASIVFGNRLASTVQVSEVSCDNVQITGSQYVEVSPGVNEISSYAGIRTIGGGNVKNFTFHTIFYSYLKVPFAFEDASGQYLVSGAVGGGAEDCLFVCSTATLTVISLEDESVAMWLRAIGGSNPAQVNFIGCTFQGAAPETVDYMVVASIAVTFIGCFMMNLRTVSTYPILQMTGLTQPLGAYPSSVTLIGCHIVNADVDTPFIIDGADTDPLKDGTGRIFIQNCMGGIGGAMKFLPNYMPRDWRWQNTATSIDPPSLAVAAVGTIGTISVPGAALGDLVEASFSLDLNGAVLRAWVSATDTVKYQFANPTAAPIDLGSGTVKVRVKK